MHVVTAKPLRTLARHASATERHPRGWAMTTDTPSKNPLHRHMQFAVSACIGVVMLIVALILRAPLVYSIGANAFFAAYIILVLAQMPRLTVSYLRKNARAADQPVLVIF